jgi:membrane-associated phospholipid phosphatase
VKVAAKIISVLFHPLLLPTYLVLVLHGFFPSMLSLRAEYTYTIIGLIFVFTFVLPSLNLITLRYFGSITSLTLESRQQRILPFTFIALLYLLVTFLFYTKLPFSQNFNKLMVIVTALVVVSLIITTFYKISVHSLAVGGGLGILLPLNRVAEQANLLWPTVILIIISGLVMSSRLLLNAHTPRQVMIGSVVGISIGFSGMIILF